MQTFPFIHVGVGNRGANILDGLLDGYGGRFTPLALVDVVLEYLAAAQQNPASRTSRPTNT